MSKLGVGVGEDFPVDDGPEKPSGPDAPKAERSEQEEFEEWRRRRAHWRAQKEQWQRQKEEWRARRRAFKAKVKAAAHESFGEDWENYRDEHRYRRGRSWFPYMGLGLLFPILAVLILIALISAVVKSPFVFLGLLVLAGIYFSHRGHHHRGRYRDYDFDLHPAGGPIVTPPPSSTPNPPPAVSPNGK